MCGIVVALAFGKLNEKDEVIRQGVMQYLTTELLIATEERGKDATGASILFDDGKYAGLKRGQRAADYLSIFGESKEWYGSLLKVWREHKTHSRVFLGHCRAATIGDKEDNENNHPIKVGNLIGIHNGVIKNPGEIFKKLGCKRDGEVDSEAIFRLFDHYTNQGKEPFTIDMVQNIVNRLDGQFAITLFNADNPYQIPVFRDGRPVEFVLLKEFGILLMISEEKFWNKIHFRYARWPKYYPDLCSMDLPAFLNKKLIEKKSLPDDSAMIFDLTKQVTENTTIDDLGEWSKIERNNKIWAATTITTTYSSGRGLGKPYSCNKSTALDEKEELTRRVYNKITKKYVTKIGDTELQDGESAIISVDTDETKVKENTAVDQNTTTAMTTTDNKQDTGNDGEDKDTDDQKDSDSSVKIDDKTIYAENKARNDVIMGIDEKDIKITEVDMKQYPKEVVEAANNAYTDMPTDKKGYGNMEDLISAVDIQDEKKAGELGIVMVANRAFNINWKDGFMAGYTVAGKRSEGPSSVDDEKAKLRERHIAGLKSMVLLLTKFYGECKGGSNTFRELMKIRLAKVISTSNISVNMDKIAEVFNTKEKEMISEVKEIIKEVKEGKN